MLEPLMGKPTAPGPAPGDVVLRDGTDDKDVQERRYQEADKPVSYVLCGSLTVVGVGCEIGGDEEQQRHEEALQPALVGAEEHAFAQGEGRAVSVVPVAERTVCVAGMHAQD